jgi:hypothetical protein
MEVNTLIGALITFVVIILVLYLVNMLPIDGRAKQIVQDHRDPHRHYLALEVPRRLLTGNVADRHIMQVMSCRVA